MFTPESMILLFCALTLACAALLRAAFFPRRRGDTPFCRKCRYNLTGVTIDTAESRCPECGVELLKKNPIRGVRPKRPWAKGAFVLALLLAIGFGGLVASERLGKIRPIEYLPESWLIARVEAGGAPAPPALAELQRREALTSIRPDTVARLIARALVVQGLPQLPPEAPGLLTDLTKRLERGLLSVEQVELYRNQVLHPVKMTIRPKIVAGSPFVIRTELELRIGIPTIVESGMITVECDDRPLQQLPRGGGHVTFGAAGAGGIMSNIREAAYVAPESLGVHAIVSRHPFSFGLTLYPAAAEVDFPFQAEFRREVEVVAEPPSDAVALVSSESAADRVPQSISVGYFQNPVSASVDPAALDRVDITSLFINGPAKLPANIHLVAFAERDGVLFHLPADISFSPDMLRRGPRQRCDVRVPGVFDRIYLAPDPRAAYMLTLFDEIWDGVLVYEKLGDPKPAELAPGAQTRVYAVPRLEPAWSIERMSTATLLDTVALYDVNAFSDPGLYPRNPDIPQVAPPQAP